MGRTIRRVPPDWEHPKYTKEQIRHSNQIDSYHPLYDQDYDSACEEWYNEALNFKPTEFSKWYHEYAGDPPNEDYYRKQKWTEEEATHYQVYENVSEGTPVTPHFATKDELEDYLVKHGDFWDQARGNGGWNKESVKRFVESSYAPSMIFIDGQVKTPRDM